MLTPYYGDPYLANVVYQTHCETLSVEDVSSYAGTTTVNGDISITSSAVKSGGGALLFGGTNGYIVLPSSAGLILSGVFVVEFFYRDYVTSKYMMSKDSSNYLQNTNYWIGGTAIALSPSLSASASYRHLAISRDASDVVRVYDNGTKIGEGTKAGGINYQGLNFGRYAPNNNGFFSGKLDDIRITSGVDRGYTGATITVPTAPKIEKLQPIVTPYQKKPLRVNGNAAIHKMGI